MMSGGVLRGGKARSIRKNKPKEEVGGKRGEKGSNKTNHRQC